MPLKNPPPSLFDETAATRTRGTVVDLSTSIVSARRVIDLEISALHRLADNIGQTFATAVERLAAVSGRVVVTGMGKSGHVARKIAATLASTGTPAMFVHPAEASHGDLGMITPTDAVLALSNSGETPELADIVAYADRVGILLISLTGHGGGTLAKAANIALKLPPIDEACPIGLAPTTSTTLMTAFGDALAAALIEHKGFSVADFRALHPGGKLGRRLLTVGDIMHVGDAMPLVDADAKMATAILEMTRKSFGCVGVLTADKRLIGVVTDGDLRRHMNDHLLQCLAADIMTPGAKTISPERLASEALDFMNAGAITNVFVVHRDRPIGILHIHDCLRADVA